MKEVIRRKMVMGCRASYVVEVAILDRGEDETGAYEIRVQTASGSIIIVGSRDEPPRFE